MSLADCSTWAAVHGVEKSWTSLSDCARTHSWLTRLWWFQVNSKGTQPYVYMYPFFPKLPSHPGCHITLSRAPCAIPQNLVGYPFKIQQCVHVDHRGFPRGKPVGSVIKNPPAKGNMGPVLGSGRSLGGGNGNLLQYSCLENSMDRGPWQATVLKVAKTWTWLSMHTCTYRPQTP